MQSPVLLQTLKALTSFLAVSDTWLSNLHYFKNALLKCFFLCGNEKIITLLTTVCLHLQCCRQTLSVLVITVGRIPTAPV